MPATARIARWSIEHWKLAVFGWLALVVALVVVGGIVGTRAQSDIDTLTGSSKHGAQMLKDAGLTPDGSEVVLITTPAGRAASPEAARLAHSIAAKLQSFPGVYSVTWNSPQLVAKDRDARIVNFDMRDGTGAKQKVAYRIGKVRDAVEQFDGTDGMRVQEFGDVTISGDVSKIVGQDMSRSELLTAPITLAILFATFGALVAAGLPLLVGIVSVVGAISLGSLISHVLPQSQFAPNLVSMMGIALGVDYTLFLIQREREERAAGRSRREAILRAAATSGTAVVISGVTVIVALSGLLLSGVSMFVSMGVATMLVVAMVLLAAVFVMPGLLHRLGGGIDRGRIPRLTRARRAVPRSAPRSGGSRAWSAVAGFAVRRPVVTLVCVGALLIGACVPVLSMHTGDSTLASLPRTKPSLVAAAAYERHFPGGVEPAQIVIRNDSGTHRTSELQRAIDRLDARAATAGIATGASTVTTKHDTTLVSMPLAGAADRAASNRAVERLQRMVDSTVGTVPHTSVALAGGAAESKSFADTLTSHMPLVFLVVLGSAFVLLACAFRSIAVPMVAVVLNLLSVGAAYGFLVWGYQHGHLRGIVPVAGHGVVVSWMPLFLFALLFGLSMDYHVFLISRIRELVLDGYSTRDAVVRGVSASAATITRAALIMVGVFSAFAMSSLSEMQQMGAGLAFAILIDATIIRGMLLPAVMSLLGEANWYMPRWLGWLPSVRTEGAPLEGRGARGANTPEVTPA